MSFRTARAVAITTISLMVAVVGVFSAPRADASHPGDHRSDHPGDGRIAFVRANQIYTMTASGRGVTKLTRAGKNYNPTWSPDGRRISFIHEENGHKDVWVMHAWGRHKQAVTRTGDVTSAGATWSPDGGTLAFARPDLETVPSRAPFGTPTSMEGYPTGGYCDDGSAPPAPIYVDRFVTWSPDGTRIAVFDHADCYYDDRIDMYFPATGELRQHAAMGGDCCGYVDWTDLFWGPENQFGYTERDLGPYGEDNNPSHILYPGFTSRDGDTGGAPSPSGTYFALTNASSGTAKIFRARADGSHRRALITGYQPDWQPVP